MERLFKLSTRFISSWFKLSIFFRYARILPFQLCWGSVGITLSAKKVVTGFLGALIYEPLRSGLSLFTFLTDVLALADAVIRFLEVVTGVFFLFPVIVFKLKSQTNVKVLLKH